MNLARRTTCHLLPGYSVEDCPSRASKSANRSPFLSRYCRSVTALVEPFTRTTLPSLLLATVLLSWKGFISSRPTPTAMSTAAAAANAGRRTQANQFRRGRQRLFANSRLQARAKYGEGSGACHSSSSLIVCCNDASSLPQAGQLRRCSCVSAEAPAFR